jgi:lipopolysaccharide transport system permease protein
MESASTAAVHVPSQRPEVVIRPAGRWETLRLGEIWEYRELLYFLTKRELQIRYKQSLVGVGWAVLQPLTMAFIFALFFGRLAKVPSEGLPYPVFALAGLVPWFFFSQSVSGAATSLVSDSMLVSKIYFPRAVIPIAKVLSLLIDLAIAMVVLLVFVLIYGVAIQPTAPLVIPFLMLAVVVALGVGLLLAPLNVRYRDVTVAVPLILQFWLFASPIVYPASLITGSWQYLYAVNPMVSVINGVRWALLGAPAPEPLAVAISAVSAIAILVAAVVYFRRNERFLADII